MGKENMGLGGAGIGRWGEGMRVRTKAPADNLHVPDSL